VTFPASASTPALVGPLLYDFSGTDPNDNWSLFVVDDTSTGASIIAYGWNPTVTTATTAPVLFSIKRTRSCPGPIRHSVQRAINPHFFSFRWSNVLDLEGIISGNNGATSAMKTNRTFHRLV